MNRTDLEDQAQRASYDRGDRRTGAAGIDIERLRRAGQNLGGQVDQQVRKRPYVAVGLAAGLGFLAGSIFGSRLGQMVLAMGVGFVVKSALAGDFAPEKVRSRLEKITGETS
jgi:hypothetical protein